jgi:dTDP-4-amino-4,6-dideoxygalactose transaminase
MTFLATANAPRLAGAEVVFSDCDPDTGLVRVTDLESAMRANRHGRLKAVIPVHLNGQCADMQAIGALAGDNGIRVIEDASHALGARHVSAAGESGFVGCCSHSDLAVFSGHPVKAIAMGEGGVITTNSDLFQERLLRARNHGITRDSRHFEHAELALDDGGRPNPWYYEMQEPGFNYRASDIHCALGLSQLRKLDRFVERRRQLVGIYNRELASLSPIVRPVSRSPHCLPAWHLYVVLIDFGQAGRTRAEVMRTMEAAGIGTQVHYIPVHKQPYYRKRYGDLRLPGAESYYSRALTLPLFPSMSGEDVTNVVAALRSSLGV